MQKSFDRPYNRPPEKNGISPAAAAFVSLLVGAVFFTAGLRYDEYSSVNLFGGEESASSELPSDLDYTSVEQFYDRLRVNYDGELSEQVLIDGLKSGLAQATGDPYTVYLTAEQAEQFTSDLNGTFTGIGAEIGIEDERLIIVAPLDGFPAQEAGLRAKDVIVSIDGEDAFGLSVEEAVLKIRGPEGSEVTLTIQRGDEQLEKTITRAAIVVPSVSTEISDGIGYLRISRFAEDTEKLTDEAADEFIAANVSGIVFDLRNNSGGFLEAAVDVASLWIDSKPVVQQREDDGQNVTQTLNASKGAKLASIPTIVLINEGSASASEIVAGALQDYDLARLLGTTSFGKGSVQSLEEFSDGSVLKVTIARWYTPNGSNIDSDGIAPDIEVELTEAQIEAEDDTQRRRAERELR